jgi:hypothetical protein
MMAGVVAAALAVAGEAAGQIPHAEFQRRQREMRARYERQAAELHRRRAAQMEARHKRRAAEMQAEHKRRAAEMKADFLRRTADEQRAQELRRRPLPFDPVAAPSPAFCLKVYMAAAARAKSMDDLYKVLPVAEKRRADESRQWQRRMNAKFAESSLSQAANTAPDDQYASYQLRRHKRIAGCILEVLSVETDNNKAVVVVSTNVGATINGNEYPYGTATIEMLGEGEFWKFDSYEESAIVHKYRPLPQP